MAPVDLAGLPVPDAVQGMAIRVVGNVNYTPVVNGVESRYKYVDPT